MSARKATRRTKARLRKQPALPSNVITHPSFATSSVKNPHTRPAEGHGKLSSRSASARSGKDCRCRIAISPLLPTCTAHDPREIQLSEDAIDTTPLLHEQLRLEAGAIKSRK